MPIDLNDNESVPTAQTALDPDAHGQAALLLVESLIHTLIARSVITVEDAVETVEVAVDVKKAIAPDLGEAEETIRKSVWLLEAIGTSLSGDLARN